MVYAVMDYPVSIANMHDETGGDGCAGLHPNAGNESRGLSRWMLDGVLAYNVDNHVHTAELDLVESSR